MTKKQKKMLYRIIAALALVLVLKLLPPLPVSVELLLYCIPYLVVGWDVHWTMTMCAASSPWVWTTSKSDAPKTL